MLRTNKLGPTLPSNRNRYGLVDEEEDPDTLVAGDVRATEQPGLASLHSLFVMEHNRIAKILSRTDNSDESIYQKTRQIVIAELQNIIYDEFLPVVLGPRIMEEYKINLPKNGYTYYESHINPSIFNEFATFAFRFGHTLIPNSFKVSMNPNRTGSNICPLKDNFFKVDQFVIGEDNSGRAWENLIDSITQIESPKRDANVNKIFTNFLFCNENCRLKDGFGQDLAARNIQRGRDHGLPGYVEYRQLCGLYVPKDWDGKPEDISQDNWNKLREVYSNVEDIDAFTGSVSEVSVADGLVGATIACILGKQFRNLMVGDRFFFTHPNGGPHNEKGLPDSLKTMVRNRKLSDIICDNLELESVRYLKVADLNLVTFELIEF